MAAALADYDELIGQVVHGWRITDRKKEGNYRTRLLFITCTGCGQERKIMATTPFFEGKIGCKYCKFKAETTIRVGDKFDDWTVIAIDPSRASRSRGGVGKGPYLCRCKCGFEKRCTEGILRAEHTRMCKKCSGVEKTLNYHDYFWKTYVGGAAARDLEVAVDWEHVHELFKQQNGKCALSGVDIELPYCHQDRNSGKATASLDRIDSKKGYIPGNLQWVHKRLNTMRMALPVEEFVWWCRCVSARHTRLPSFSLN